MGAILRLFAPQGKNSCDFVSRDGDIHGEQLLGWLRKALRKIFKPNLNLTCSTGRIYDVEYTLPGYLEATCGNRIISFDLVPAFEFSWCEWPSNRPLKIPLEIATQYSWYVIPQKLEGSYGGINFFPISPMWEKEIMKDEHHLKHVLRLMKGLRDAHKAELPHLTSFMLKNVILNNLNYDRNLNLETLFEKMWSYLVEHLRIRRLDYYLDNGYNVFDEMDDQELSKCLSYATMLQREIQINLHNNSYKKLSKLFGLKLYPYS